MTRSNIVTNVFNGKELRHCIFQKVCCVNNYVSIRDQVTNTTLAKSHLSKAKSQVSDIRTIGPLVILLISITLIIIIIIIMIIIIIIIIILPL